MTVGAKGSWSFILSFRGTKLCSHGTRRILDCGFNGVVPDSHEQPHPNPSIMGFDALYILIQTLVVFFLRRRST